MRENKINFNRTTTVTRLSHVEMHQSHMIPSRLDLTIFPKKASEKVKKNRCPQGSDNCYSMEANARAMYRIYSATLGIS